MITKNAAMGAYQKAMLDNQQRIQKQVTQSVQKVDKPQESSFGETITDSLKAVNDLQGEKKQMMESFAAGKTSNVHELMIQLQKAGMAMSVTSAVRSKVMSAYQELMRMQF